MKCKTFRILLAVLLTVSMCLTLCQCAKENSSENGNGGNDGSETVSIAASPSTQSVPAGATAIINVTVTGGTDDLEAAGMKLVWTADPSGNTDAVIEDNGGTSLTGSVTVPTVGKYVIHIDLQDNGGTVLASTQVTIDAAEASETPPEPVNASIYVPFVTSNEDFIRGTDVSSLLVVLGSGARFKDWDGNSLGESVEENGANFMKLLHDAGVNWVRLRVWNDPYDENGNGYGGGNNDLQSAITMGKWATDAGMRVLIDFHYSDFWADPSRQLVPKAWEGMDIDTKAKALGDFTTDSLNALLDAGVDVGMVQVGNETTNSICGENEWVNMNKLYNAGCDAVHAVGEARGLTIMTCVHMESPQSADFDYIARNLTDGGVKFDVFATSYYPQWHGSKENMANKLKSVADKYGVKVMVAETRAPYTADDGDGSNSNAPTEYAISPQGQALEYADVAKAVHDIGSAGLGLFYWENAWIPVRNISQITGDERAKAIEENKRIWDECGSGWASSYAQDYDPNAANGGYGGPDMNNKAMFDFDGVPLESLNVFKYLLTGTTGYEDHIVNVPAVTLHLTVGDQVELPDSLEVETLSGSRETVAVTWQDMSFIDGNSVGQWDIKGYISDGDEKVWTWGSIQISQESMLPNSGFENGADGYTVENWPGDGINDLSANAGNVHGGSWCLHFWKASAFEDAVTSTTVSLEAGTYKFFLYGQGGDMGENNTYIFARTTDGEVTERFELDGYLNWKTPEVTFTLESAGEVTLGVSVSAGAGAWGTFDDWVLYKVD